MFVKLKYRRGLKYWQYLITSSGNFNGSVEVSLRPLKHSRLTSLVSVPTFCIAPACHKIYYDVRIAVRTDTTARGLRSLTLIARYAGLKAPRLANLSKKSCLHNLELWTVVTVRIYPSAVFRSQFRCFRAGTVRTSAEEPVLRVINKLCGNLIVDFNPVQ